ncbi:L-serine ammonia-lyase, iron-sulfur-dependent, subunit alpha [Telmatospirillum sp.]|uniref:L-cysteine desulfidase family protein n=1 Tax=Telmatospirillum sp. TaxID=2079197 RepID=UPI002842270F|nr:L-serine ammonia-lyase, iron-sulfur-dependent, subunit alpha [Telmatospirillum sp.]MDR3440959.1 L-serine ammonia-lyase, iron-sulfur-dependent, subunit alpha [Telmatospirillum sp.]
MNALWFEYIHILRQEVVPALGCTEPIAVALASAQCRRILGVVPNRLTVWVSGNIYKNGMGVGVPGTGMVGLPVAAAIGAVAGDPDAGLQVLKTIEPAHMDIARALLHAVHVTVKDVDDPLYAEVLAESDDNSARVIICHEHTRVVLREHNGVCLYREAEDALPCGDLVPAMSPMTLHKLIDFAAHVPLADIAFMQDAVTLNTALSTEGQSGKYGMRIGATLYEQVQLGVLSDDLMTLAMRLSSAASDARMDGAMLPAMANSGSGNQGISATMPVVAAAMMVKASNEQLIRAITLSNIVAIYIKSHQNSLSALCAANTAAMGAGAAITWLLGGNEKCIEDCIHNMIGDVAGIICDGAKTSCSMKVSTAAAAAVKAALLANSHIRVSANEGIVAETADATIANLGNLSRIGMLETDRQIIRIMMDKQ